MEKTINKIYNLVLKYKGCTLNDEECKLFQELQNDLEEKEKQDKILEILKNKKVDIKLVLWAGQKVEAYNVVVREQKDYWWREELTQEEFDLIREWLEK